MKGSAELCLRLDFCQQCRWLDYAELLSSQLKGEGKDAVKKYTYPDYLEKYS